ncbi:hypothetical protein GCM10010266_67000 [Streptomyces griseomycini]|nr:hypothetical protein GCM10010266_67000 [Streptomyces griseomycini]GGR51287.1 hypothetical protein GCM10015536_65980 [Streptomyces griseomycini]
MDQGGRQAESSESHRQRVRCAVASVPVRAGAGQAVDVVGRLVPVPGEGVVLREGNGGTAGGVRVCSSGVGRTVQ